MASVLLALAADFSVIEAEGPSSPDFERNVAPILIERCLECHQPAKKSGGLDLSNRQGVFDGGDSGPAVTPGNIDESYLIDRVASGEMPPRETEAGKPTNKRPLPEKDVDVLKRWIAAGAAWPEDRELGLHEMGIDLEAGRQFWSFRPVVRPPIPAVNRSDQVANPIDAFLLWKLEEAGLQMSPAAARGDWLRRAHLDLLGLPPSPAEQDRFAADDSPDAFERVVDDILARPGYGERWARHWLDLVRYADTNGYERDGDKPSVWRYRDYVIASLNADKPYDRFVVEQLAGDEVEDASAETLIALGFYALGTWQDEVDPLEQPQYRADELDDLIRTSCSTFLGITIGCARCHNHKFDPLSMVDYYSLAAVLDPLRRPNEGRTDRDKPAGTRQQLAALAARDAKIAPLNEQIKNIEAAEKEGQPVDGAAEQLAELKQQIEELRRETPDLVRAYYLFEPSHEPPETFLLLRGRASNPGPKMQPRAPAVLAPSQPEFPGADEQTSRRRITLARWIASRDNPLTARVIVNRVWQHHFGIGLVATPNDFGAQGERPTHPELLDWLAHWLMHDADWSLKRLHYLIMTTNAYRMSAAHNARAALIDPQNKLLWRFPRRRLEAETIRDSMLAASGQINRQMYGPPASVRIHPAAIEAHTDKQKAWTESSESQLARRTIYAKIKRTLLPPMLEVLDLCDTTRSSGRRPITNIAPQALTLYNGEFVNRQAGHFADRLLREAEGDVDAQIELASKLALCRPPTEKERQAMRAFLCDEAAALIDQNSGARNSVSEDEANRQSLVQLCRVVLNLNEFVYPN